MSVSRLYRLGALAGGFARIPTLRTETGPWAYAPSRQVILIGPSDTGAISERDRALCAHEAAHARITRYLSFPRLTGLSDGMSATLLNAVEDCRIHEWLARRYSGVLRRWLATLREETRGPKEFGPSALREFLAAAAVGEVYDYGPPDEWRLSDIADAALEETREARRAYARAHLPQDVERSDAARIAEAAAEEVSPILDAPLRASTHEELYVLLGAARAWRIAETEIAPTVRALQRYDLERMAGAAAADAALSRRLRERRRFSAKSRCQAAAAALSRGLRRPIGGADPGLEQTLEGYILGESDTRDRRGPRARGRMAKGLPKGPGGRGAPLELSGGEIDTANALISEAMSQVQPITQLLRRQLRSKIPEGWRSGFRSGSRPSLPALMQAEADPRFDRVWMRRLEETSRFAADVSILVDLSGSMRGEKIAHAAAAVIAIAKALEGLPQLRWRVIGFQDQLIDIVEAGGVIEPEALRDLMLGEAWDMRPDGWNKSRWNDDGPCLLEAAERFAPTNGLTRLMIVLSDGLPSGRRSTAKDLDDAVEALTARAIHIVGIGVGPDTQHVTSHYPNARADIPLDQLAASISEAIGEKIGRATAIGAPR